MRRELSTPAVTAAFVSTLLLLGIVGGAAGWVAAGSELERQGQTDPTTSAQASKPPTSSPTSPRPTTPSPTPALTGTPTETPSRPDQFEMPNLVNKDFRTARLQAKALKLGVEVFFNEPSRRADGTVERTVPEARTYVFPGLAIHLYVAGPPPPIFVPDVLDKTCEEAKDIVLDAGLKIANYPRGPRGTVKQTDPAPGSPAKWNDGVRLYCFT